MAHEAKTGKERAMEQRTAGLHAAKQGGQHEARAANEGQQRATLHCSQGRRPIEAGTHLK